jgi:heptaprenyl diphosphate synthase
MINLNKYIDSTAKEITEFMQDLEFAEAGMNIDVSKGKKLRGCLAVMVSDLLGGDRTKALEFASAVELIHLGSLTHDDVIDEHDTRRGSIPLNLLKGTKFAILAGDRMFTRAIKIGSQSGKKEAQEVADAMEAVLAGAMKEISIKEFFSDAISGEVADKFYYKMIGLKTAGLFKSAGKFGAMAFTEKDDIVSTFGDYGYCIGISYQIADDITDIIKLSEGKKEPDIGNIISVVPAALNYGKKDIKKIPFILMSGRITIDNVLDMVASIDMSSKMKDDINKYINESISIIDGFDISNDYTNLLKKFPKYCVNQILSEVDEVL